MIVNKDCLDAMAGISDDSIDMIYLDPPFFSQKDQKLSDSEGIEYRFSDTWNSRSAYLEYMEERLYQMHRILKTEGSIFLQCDTSASHYLKMLMDRVFGEVNFRSEIIWYYKRWSNSQNGLIPNHQTILYYSKTEKFKFNPIYKAYSPTTNIDQILQERERVGGKSVYRRDLNGNPIIAREKKGVPLSDVWEIPFLNPKAKERIGYPTQKPIELLERIIAMSTDEGDLVLDPFCGSGTTLVCSKLMNRRYIGVDISEEAVKLSLARLDAPVKSCSMLLAKGIDAYRTKSENDLAILKQFDCDIVQRNRGIDAFLKRHYLDAPVAIKIQRETESISEAIQLLSAAGKKKKCSFTILITGNSLFLEDVAPDNMIIIKRYDVEARCRLETMIK